MTRFVRSLGLFTGVVLLAGCGPNLVRERCEAARLTGRPSAASECAQLRASSWRSSSDAAEGHRGIVGRR